MIKKFLKGLFILCLTLLPICFTSAYTYKQDFDIPYTFVKGNMTYVILDNFNFSTFYQNTTLNHILFSESNLSSNGRNRLHSFFAFYDGKPYLYADYIHDGNRSYVYQGFPTQFCLATAGSGQSVCVPSGRSCPKNTDISVFYNAGKLTHGTYYGYGNFTSTYETRTYCISDDVNDYCFSVNASSNNCGNYLTGSLNVPGTSIEQLQSFDWSSSPFSSSATLPDYSVGTGRQLRNYEVLMGFEYMGLSKEYCYGGFDIDNIFLPSEQFSDFSGYSFGSGASIFDLYYTYGGGLSMKPFLSTYYQSFLNAQLSNFHNKSKSLLMLFQQYQSANDREWGSFKLNDLMDYCDLYFNLKNNNRENDGDIYTGNNQSAINSYKLNRKIPEGGFTNTGVLATGSQFTGFSSADEFFGRLTNLFQSGINGVEDTFPPMIPSYIVAFMLAIILIRIISH